MAPKTPTARRKAKSEDEVAWWYHVLLALIIASIFWLANSDETWYESLMQEDRLVEWATVFFFFAAAVMGGWRAYQRRRWFDGLVALFCFFVAGEEFSWGQRLLGFTAPSYFLEHNRQQELTLHNFADIFGQPKWMFVLALTGYGIVLPLLPRWRHARPWIERARATPPPVALLPWFAAAVILLIWYPLEFTGEWVELLGGMLFAMSLSSGSYLFATLSLNAVLFSALLTWWSGRSLATPQVIGCAREETALLVDAIAIQPRLASAGESFHKRIWTAHEEGRIDFVAARTRLAGAPCLGVDNSSRRQFGIDPWGTAYWIRFDFDSDDLTVYSFGPNRRRDEEGGDDVMSARAIGEP